MAKIREYFGISRPEGEPSTHTRTQQWSAWGLAVLVGVAVLIILLLQLR